MCGGGGGEWRGKGGGRVGGRMGVIKRKCRAQMQRP